MLSRTVLALALSAHSSIACMVIAFQLACLTCKLNIQPPPTYLPFTSDANFGITRLPFSSCGVEGGVEQVELCNSQFCSHSMQLWAYLTRFTPSLGSASTPAEFKATTTLPTADAGRQASAANAAAAAAAHAVPAAGVLAASGIQAPAVNAAAAPAPAVPEAVSAFNDSSTHVPPAQVADLGLANRFLVNPTGTGRVPFVITYHAAGVCGVRLSEQHQLSSSTRAAGSCQVPKLKHMLKAVVMSTLLQPPAPGDSSSGLLLYMHWQHTKQ